MNRNVLVSCLLVTVMLLASCSKKNDYEKVLPKDAAVVMSSTWFRWLIRAD